MSLSGKVIYAEHQKEVNTCLSDYISEDGIVNETNLKEDWFSTTKKDDAADYQTAEAIRTTHESGAVCFGHGFHAKQECEVYQTVTQKSMRFRIEK